MRKETRRGLFTAVVLAALALLGPLPAAEPAGVGAGTLDRIQARGGLLVGMEIGYFPFEYLDPLGRPVGFDVELAGLLAEDLGVKLEIRDMAWNNLIPALRSGQIDCIISALTRTSERAALVGFSESYFETGLSLLLNRKRARGVESLQGLDGKDRIVVVVDRSSAAGEAMKLFSFAQVKPVSREFEGVEAVLGGAADALFIDQLTVWKRRQDFPEETFALLAPLTLEFLAAAVPPGDQVFLDRVNSFLALIKKNGKLEELKQRHLGQMGRTAN
ncbi:MAG: transporter substrate-binding domain-containing protein [Pseudomonadota bacterium]